MVPVQLMNANLSHLGPSRQTRPRITGKLGTLRPFQQGAAPRFPITITLAAQGIDVQRIVADQQQIRLAIGVDFITRQRFATLGLPALIDHGRHRFHLRQLGIDPTRRERRIQQLRQTQGDVSLAHPYFGQHHTPAHQPVPVYLDHFFTNVRSMSTRFQASLQYLCAFQRNIINCLARHRVCLGQFAHRPIRPGRGQNFDGYLRTLCAGYIISSCAHRSPLIICLRKPMMIQFWPVGNLLI